MYIPHSSGETKAKFKVVHVGHEAMLREIDFE